MALTITFEILADCDDLSCVIFKDVTKAYNASTNPTGYGYPPNFPSISDIISTDFLIVDKDSKEWVFNDSGYLPNALGTSTICLKGSDFTNSTDTLTFVKGQTYTLHYFVNTNDSESFETIGSFVFACCGDPVASNLGTDFSIVEQTGFSSIDFTDTTGTYNADTNPGGYGSPNPAYTDITETSIVITKSNGTVTTIDTWKPTASDQTLNINAHTLGYSDNLIPDQIISVEYKVYTAGKCRVGLKDADELLDGQTVACIAKKGAILLNSACNDCGTDEQNEVDFVLRLKYEYEIIKTSADNGDFECIQGDIEKLFKECNQGCDGC